MCVCESSSLCACMSVPVCVRVYVSSSLPYVLFVCVVCVWCLSVYRVCVCVCVCVFVCASVCVCVSLLSVSVGLLHFVSIFVYFCLKSDMGFQSRFC